MSTKMQPQSLEALLVAQQKKIDQLDRRLARIGSGTASAPTGSILAFAGDVAPPGYLLARGQEYDPTLYPALYAAIGVTYGGSPTAPLLPDLRGRTPVGMAPSDADFNALGKSGGEKAHTLTAAEQADMPVTRGLDPTAFVNIDQGGTLGGWSVQPAAVNNGAQPATANGGGQPHNNLQPYLVLNFIIKV